MMNGRTDGYLSLASYGLIGDCRSAALVGIDGSIDWLCLPRFDDGSLFGRILDAHKGGYWQLSPQAPHRMTQRYRDRTNILQTTFATNCGVVAVTDFMPIVEHPRTGGEQVIEPRLVRLVEGLTGHVTMVHDIVPAPDYARCNVSFTACQGVFHADVGDTHMCIASTDGSLGAHSTFTVKAGEAVAFGLSYTPEGQCHPHNWSIERARDLARSTQDYWWHWIGRCRYYGPFQEPVWRSALALKLMTYAPTGAIIAAPTTSLPELIGGPRNWDYRFTWLRDASFTLYAFFQLGLIEEARQFFAWLVHIGIGGHAPDIPNLLSLSGHSSVEEIELDHLEGYRCSRPVRIGNGAAHQLQLDIYGELLDSAYLYARFGGVIGPDLWRELRAIVDLAIARWDETDASIWEVRGPNRHFTYSKVMCWVAVDRGLRIAEKFGLPHDSQRWKEVRRAIRRSVSTQGYSARRGAFTQAFGEEALDASLLRLCQVHFLKNRDPRLRSTVQAIASELGEGVLVRRYDPQTGQDGLNTDEGGFLMCSFWLVDALAHLGEVEEAQRLFEQILGFASPLLLFAEEADTVSGELLGNYPQAFTHLSLIGAAVNIERARRKQLGP
jgi:GH15 family glucan-1,4-alpha-glucosidase